MRPTCKKCGAELELMIDDETGDPQDDYWWCEACQEERRAPLPRGHVKAVRAAERLAELQEQRESERLALEAWNRWARG